MATCVRKSIKSSRSAISYNLAKHHQRVDPVPGGTYSMPLAACCAKIKSVVSCALRPQAFISAVRGKYLTPLCWSGTILPYLNDLVKPEQADDLDA